MAGSRALVHESIKDQLIEEISLMAADIVVGDPLNAKTHVGPLCTLHQIERIEQTLALSEKQGATIQFGGGRSKHMVDGYYFQPTLIDCPDSSIESLKTEMFGPVMSVQTFKTEAQAIELANDTEFGLGSGIFTQNVARAHRVSQKIRSGICWVNTYRMVSPIAPFGGYNQSGYGREAGLDAIHDYTRTKTTWINLSDEAMANPFVIR